MKPVKKQKLSLDEAVKRGVISQAERDEIDQTDTLVRQVLVVDDFDPSELTRATLSQGTREDDSAAA
jgi:hypothetical protein